MLQIDPYNKIKAELKTLTNISYISLTNRCNSAIKIALDVARKLGKEKCCIFDQGGWMKYSEFAEQAGYTIKVIKTKNCAISLSNLKKELDSKSVVLMHSLSGYFFPQPMKEIYEVCKSKEVLLINDCCGSIGETDLLSGDIFVCSFGNWKPINYGKGGFIGTRSSELFYNYLRLDESNAKNAISSPEDLYKKISSLNQRKEKLYDISKGIIKDLKKVGLLPLDFHKNLCVIVPFKNELQKKDILEFCARKKLEFTECPREIRILQKAISIEVKRIDT
jgi:dTDP-4-amino-4,6-dideoxygalactose transaminase